MLAQSQSFLPRGLLVSVSTAHPRWKQHHNFSLSPRLQFYSSQNTNVLVFQIAQHPQDCKPVQSIGAHGQRYKLWFGETKDELLVIQRMEKNQYLLGSAPLLCHKITLSSFPSLQIWYLSYICFYSPSQKHPLASSHFYKLVSICSNLVYHHWFRDNLEQTLADSCDSNLPCSPYGRHLIC